MTEPPEKEPLRFQTLERVVIRMRDDPFAQSAWRMVVESDGGGGGITLVDQNGRALYRGDGIFLGWSQGELRATYERLERPADEPSVDLPEFG